MKMNGLNKELQSKQESIQYQPIGWRSLLQTKAGTSRILILKSVVQGLCLEKGMPIHSYAAEDASGRQIMISYLDGKPRLIGEEENG